LVPLTVTIVLWYFWTFSTGSREDSAPLDIGRGQSAPPHWQVERPPSWWAMLFTIGGDTVLLSSLLFGALFLLVVAPDWPPPAFASVSWLLLAGMVAGGLIAAVAARFALKRLVAANGNPLIGLLAATTGHALTIICAVAGIMGLGDLTVHAQTSMVCAILAASAIHAGIGILLLVYGLQRQSTGTLSALRTMDLRIGNLWHDFPAVAVLACVVVALVLQVDLSSTRVR